MIMMMALLLAMPSLAQTGLQFGFKGGLQLTEMSFSSDMLGKNNRAGFCIGPTLKIGTPITGFFVDVAALYDQRDLKVDGQVLKQKSLIIPGNARLGTTVFNTFGVFLCAGPQLSFNVGKDMLQWIDDKGNAKQFALQNTTLSLNIGGGVTIGRHIEAAVYYNLPLGKTADFTWNTLQEQLEEQSWDRAKTTVDAWRLCVAYYF